MSSIFTSSIGKKLLMSLAGIFLITFLLVHLGINLLVILNEDPMVFNRAAHFMGTNKVIKIFEIVLFGGFLLHIIYALILQVQNWLARPKRYHKMTRSDTSAFSRWMIHTALIVFAFLAIHLADFYFKAKFGDVGETSEEGVHDLASLIIDKFQMPGFVIFYVASFIFLGFHLIHGFQSAFKTLGLNNKTYTPVIQVLSILYTIIVVGGFTAIPIVIYFQ
ncbi:MAG: succinate dehydrogenase cytochrome b subunit [Bacteroidales bacterium]|nr:succinate dehydrogenase cytochrome b subunit [Bacteroidales bacterium]MDT8432425.1 succinate dehydrogenase cytochrome b subunit [Bacteroidales bacterium]